MSAATLTAWRTRWRSARESRSRCRTSTLRTSRSSGPGGQHANVTASRVEAVFDVASSSLPEEEKRRIQARLGPRVTAVAQDARGQARNRELALERLRDRLVGSAQAPPPASRDPPHGRRPPPAPGAEAPPRGTQARRGGGLRRETSSDVLPLSRRVGRHVPRCSRSRAGAASTCSAPTTRARSQAPALTGRVVRVVDGDTVKVRLPDRRRTVTVRYIGVDTPESVKPGSPSSASRSRRAASTSGS